MRGRFGRRGRISRRGSNTSSHREKQSVSQISSSRGTLASNPKTTQEMRASAYEGFGEISCPRLTGHTIKINRFDPRRSSKVVCPDSFVLAYTRFGRALDIILAYMSRLSRTHAPLKADPPSFYSAYRSAVRIRTNRYVVRVNRNGSVDERFLICQTQSWCISTNESGIIFRSLTG